MTDREIQAVYKLLQGNFSFDILSMPTNTCLVFREVPIRFGKGWVRLLNETFPCHQPADVITAMREGGLIRPKAEAFLKEQLPFYITKQLKNQ